MTVSHTPVPARSDLVPGGRTAHAADRLPYAGHGRLLSAGALMWAAAILAVGLDPVGNPTGLVVFMVGSGIFQLGLLALLRVLYRTNALGEGRLARFFLRAETVLVTLAITSTVVDGFGISDLSHPGWALLDAFWPLSMVGMFLIGVRVAIAGRWKGVTRFWPLVAESWAVVCIPVLGVFGAGVAQVVAALHLVVGYTVLGVLVSRKEQ